MKMKWTQAEIDYLVDNYKTKARKVIVYEINQKFGQNRTLLEIVKKSEELLLSKRRNRCVLLRRIEVVGNVTTHRIM